MSVDPLTIATAAAVIIGAFFGGLVAVMKMRGEQAVLLKQVSVVAVNTTAINDKAKEIHDLVNGSAHAAAAKLEALENQVRTLNGQITALHERIAALQEQRVIEAQAAPPKA